MDNQAIAERLDRLETLTMISAKTILGAEEASIFTGYSLYRIYRLFFRKTELEEWLLEHKVKTSEEIAAEADTYTARRRTNRVQASRI